LLTTSAAKPTGHIYSQKCPTPRLAAALRPEWAASFLRQAQSLRFDVTQTGQQRANGLSQVLLKRLGEQSSDSLLGLLSL